MVKQVDADQVEGGEKKSRFHLLKFLFTGLLLLWGFQLLTQPRKEETPTETVTVYHSLDQAFSQSLPEHEYQSIKIKDQSGKYDPVTKGDIFLGYVHDDAEVLINEGKEVGYIISGAVYNKPGKKIGRFVSGRHGQELYSFENKKWGIFSQNKLISLDGTVMGTVGSKAAVLMDSSSTLTGIIVSYDFSRKNL